MTHRVLVTGAAGQLGQELVLTAGSARACVAMSRQQLDIGDLASIEVALDQHRPDTVINAAAYTAVDAAESDAAAAWRINALGPEHLASACRARDIRLIHVSTDFVFDGQGTRPYRVNDNTHPLGEYGRSKRAAETSVLAALPDAVVVRSSWVYSRFGGNFVKTMLRLMAEREELAVVADQRGAPTWARGLASALWRAAETPGMQGIHHWSDAGECSWYEFAVAIAEEAVALGLLPRSPGIKPITSAEYPTPARRPAYSVLDTSTTMKALDMQALPWREQLRAMLLDLKQYKDGETT